MPERHGDLGQRILQGLGAYAPRPGCASMIAPHAGLRKAPFGICSHSDSGYHDLDRAEGGCGHAAWYDTAAPAASEVSLCMSGIISGLLCALAWALGSVSMKELSKKLDPLTLNAPRSLAAGLFALLFTLISGRAEAYQALTWEKLAFMLGSVWIGGGLGDTAYIISMARIGVSRAFPVSSTYPVLTLIISILFLGESASWTVAGGLVLVLGGILLLGRSTGDSLDTPRAANASGILLAVVASVCWAIASVLVAPGVKGLDPIMVSSIRVPAFLVAGLGSRGHPQNVASVAATLTYASGCTSLSADSSAGAWAAFCSCTPCHRSVRHARPFSHPPRRSLRCRFAPCCSRKS